jgi:hypothetical protein
MFKPTQITRSPSDHFMRAVEDEFSKFERKERAFRQAERADCRYQRTIHSQRRKRPDLRAVLTRA